MFMKIFRITDPEIGACLGTVAAISQGAALDIMAGKMGWDSYAEYVAAAEAMLEKTPGAGIRTLEAEEVQALAKAA